MQGKEVVIVSDRDKNNSCIDSELHPVDKVKKKETGQIILEILFPGFQAVNFTVGHGQIPQDENAIISRESVA